MNSKDCSVSEILSDFKDLHLGKTRSGRVYKETGGDILNNHGSERERRRSERLKNKSSDDLSLNETVLDFLETINNEKTENDNEGKNTKNENKTPGKISTPRTPKANFRRINKENTSTPKTPKYESNKNKTPRSVLEDISLNLPLVSKPDKKPKSRSKSESSSRRPTPGSGSGADVKIEMWTDSSCEPVLDISTQESYLNDSCSVSHCQCHIKCLPNRCSCRLGDILCGVECGCSPGCNNVYVRIENIVKVGPSLIPGGGLGCFVTQPVKAGHIIQEYLGEIVSRKVSDRRQSLERNSFLVELDDKLDIDGARGGSEVCRSNHSKNPSAELIRKYIRVPGGVRPAVYVRARRALNPGNEVTLDYGPEYPTSDFFA